MVQHYLLFHMLSTQCDLDTLLVERWSLCFFPLNVCRSLCLIPQIECSRSDAAEARFKKGHADSASFCGETYLWSPELLCKTSEARM